MSANHDKPRTRLISFSRVNKGSVRGFYNVELPSGLILKEVSAHVSHYKTWAALRAKAMLDAGGNTMRDAGGKVRYAPVVEWGIPALRDEFSQSGAALAHLARADVFDAEGP
jgi:hypothetical protein